MSITYTNQVVPKTYLGVLTEYPSGCLSDVYEYNYGGYKSLYSRADYDREQRPYPEDPERSLTSRPYVYDREEHAPEGSLTMTYFACPHNGQHGTVRRTWYHTGVSTLNPNLLGADSLRDQLLWAGKLRDKLSVQKVNLGSSLAEYRESTKLFVNTAKSIHRVYQILRGRIPRKKLKACSIPASVLGFNFGVAPLVNDLYSSVEALRFRMDSPIYRKLSVGVRIQRHGSIDIGPWHYESDLCEYKERAAISYKVNPSQYLSNDFDFGNPIEWAWELIPFSFVVDWAIPIGEWLGRLDALQGIEDITGTVTTRTSENYRYTSNQIRQITMGTLTNYTYQRDVINDIPMPPIPKWSPSLSYKRVINAVSLLFGISKPCRKG